MGNFQRGYIAVIKNFDPHKAKEQLYARFPYILESSHLRKNDGWPEFLGPPKHLEEFENRLRMCIDILTSEFLGKGYYLDVDERKTIQKDFSLENLIETAILSEKKCSYKELTKKELFSNKNQDSYSFLKKTLERKFPFSETIQACLGIPIDLSGISLPEKRTIAVQAAAQVLWFYKKGLIALVPQMRVEIWNNKSLVSLLGLRRFQNSKVVEDWIRVVNPKPKEMRKGAPSKRRRNNDYQYSHIVLIPEIFSENPNRTNFLKLRFAVMVIGKILSAIGLTQKEVLSSRILQAYQEPLKFYPRKLTVDWVMEALLINGSIYDL